MIKFTEEELLRCIEKILIKNGLCEHQAAVVADCMVSTELHGVTTHGVSMIKAYAEKLKNGAFNVGEEPVAEKKTSAFARLDAKNTIGMYSAVKAMELAIEMCKESSIYYVFVKNANTFGAAFYYSLMAAKENLIGICFSNTPPSMCAWGGKSKMFGTNPFAVAIPGREKGPVILDMATSIVAKSKINEIRKKGEKIPEGWALDEEGNPTTDPEAAIRGSILPMAEYKGYGIAMIIDILSGVLSGAGFLNGVNKFYSENNECMNVGQCFIAIDPAVIYSDDFYNVMDDYIDSVHKSGDNVLIPGERKLSVAEKNRREGITISENTENDIKNLLQ